MARKKNEAPTSLRQFVRTKGAGYLSDPNVSSIGIGHKVSGGRTTDEVAIQFTVRRKAAPEELAALGTAPLPAVIEVDGVAVPTDVLQRDYRVEFRVLEEAAVDPRKTRVDPVVPGVSVGHVRVSAGTVGCVVHDREDGTPYVLSNWHVLHGPQGALGDDVVQPGVHDDNRTGRNRLGRLVRSHLGAAGDCAIATVEDRGFAARIHELGVAVDKLGEPDLGDKVVKSGRTTGVTHGVVRRVDVLAKIDYGPGVGQREIGCFEIGPDRAKPAPDGEISRGGDSGAAWVFKSANGKPGRTLAGLHFAGEAAGDADEHALACLPGSVFEKLGISITPPKGVRPERAARLGFDPDFLGTPAGLPVLGERTRADAVELDGEPVIDYTHFSLAQSKSRRFALWVAWNIDGGGLKQINRSGIPFVLDPRVPAEHQVGDELYRGNRLDRGHLARRADLLWGPDAEQANVDSFYFTNITPQMDDFNQSSRRGLWGRLEDAVLADAEVDRLRVSVYGGPVFRADDRVFRGVALPREYWKVVVFASGGALTARAFLLTQNLNQLESLELDEFRVFQVKVAEVEERCGFAFPDEVRAADALVLPSSTDERAPLGALTDILW
ncbi:DNA/RNA non-specific endonuclease [Saccharothrix xinjiangensis]|uniref:DNA/RNA non-specific endonuclease n=1 Tax=Saccharothrix xinjiangensis TaxID=204798 RepID=A0ABV9Y9X5_9PSEU